MQTALAISPETTQRPTLNELYAVEFQAPAQSVRRWIWDQKFDFGTAAQVAVMLLATGGSALATLLSTGNVGAAIGVMLAVFLPFAVIAGSSAGAWLDQHLFQNKKRPSVRVKPGQPTVTRSYQRDEAEKRAMAVADIAEHYGVEIAPEDWWYRVGATSEYIPVQARVIKTGRPVTVSVHYPTYDSPAVVKVISPLRTRLFGSQRSA